MKKLLKPLVLGLLAFGLFGCASYVTLGVRGTYRYHDAPRYYYNQHPFYHPHKVILIRHYGHHRHHHHR